MIIKIPRVRIFDCTRLIFRLGEEPEWRDIDFDPDLFPVYPIPQQLARKIYTFRGHQVNITPGWSINNLAKEVCRILRESEGSWDREYLHTIILDDKTGEITIQTEKI